MKTIKLFAEAEAELDEAVAYYERQQDGLGLELHEEVTKALDHIADNPKFALPYERGFRHYIVHRFPYVIYYKERQDEVVVVAFAHAKRMPDYWKGRLR